MIGNRYTPIILALLFLLPLSSMGQSTGDWNKPTAVPGLMVPPKSVLERISLPKTEEEIVRERRLAMLRSEIPELQRESDDYVEGAWLFLCRSPIRWVRDECQFAVWRHEGVITPQVFNKNFTFIAGFGDLREILGKGVEAYMRPGQGFNPYDLWVLRRGRKAPGIRGMLGKSGLDLKEGHKMCEMLSMMEEGSREPEPARTGLGHPVGADGPNAEAAGGSASPFGRSSDSSMEYANVSEQIEGLKGRGKAGENPILFAGCPERQRERDAEECAKKRESQNGPLGTAGEEPRTAAQTAHDLHDQGRLGRLFNEMEKEIGKRTPEEKTATSELSDEALEEALIRSYEKAQKSWVVKDTASIVILEGIEEGASDEELHDAFVKWKTDRVNNSAVSEPAAGLPVSHKERVEAKAHREAADFLRKSSQLYSPGEMRKMMEDGAKEYDQRAEELEKQAIEKEREVTGEQGAGSDCVFGDIECENDSPFTKEQNRLHAELLKKMGLEDPQTLFLRWRHFADQAWRQILTGYPADQDRGTGEGIDSNTIAKLTGMKGDTLDPQGLRGGSGGKRFSVGNCGEFVAQKECLAGMPGPDAEFCDQGGGRTSLGPPRPTTRMATIQKGGAWNFIQQRQR